MQKLRNSPATTWFSRAHSTKQEQRNKERDMCPKKTTHQQNLIGSATSLDKLRYTKQQLQQSCLRLLPSSCGVDQCNSCFLESSSASCKDPAQQSIERAGKNLDIFFECSLDPAAAVPQLLVTRKRIRYDVASYPCRGSWYPSL